MRRGIDAAQHYERRQAEALHLLAGYENLSRYIDEQRATIEQLAGDAALELAGSYLPDNSPAALARVEQLTGFLGFTKRDPNAAREHEKQVLEHTIARIQSDPRYVSREQTVGAGGSLKVKRDELAETLEPLEAAARRYEDLDGFIELIHVKYDTPEFTESWWQPSYWRYWKTGDHICKQLGVADFGDDILPAYSQAAEQRDYWRGELAIVDKQVAEVHALVKAHDNAVATIPNLPNMFVRQSREFLTSYLADADIGLLESWLRERAPDDRKTLSILRRYGGLRAKYYFLGEIKDKGIAADVEQLRRRSSKYARKMQKFVRHKHYYRQVGDHELDLKFEAKYQKLVDRQTKLRKLIDRLMAYKAYDRFSLQNQWQLWWLEFTRKAPPLQLPIMRQWYARHSNLTAAHDDLCDDDLFDDDDDVGVEPTVAQALASRELDEVGYLS